MHKTSAWRSPLEKILWAKCRHLEANVSYFIEETERMQAEITHKNGLIIELNTLIEQLKKGSK